MSSLWNSHTSPCALQVYLSWVFSPGSVFIEREEISSFYGLYVDIYSNYVDYQKTRKGIGREQEEGEDKEEEEKKEEEKEREKEKLE